MDLVSSRRRAIGPRQAELLAAFEARHSREPTALERDRIARQAMQATRKSMSMPQWRALRELLLVVALVNAVGLSCKR
jgi:hypothetical protein